jgi:hypothetical protein
MHPMSGPQPMAQPPQSTRQRDEAHASLVACTRVMGACAWRSLDSPRGDAACELRCQTVDHLAAAGLVHQRPAAKEGILARQVHRAQQQRRSPAAGRAKKKSVAACATLQARRAAYPILGATAVSARRTSVTVRSTSPGVSSPKGPLPCGPTRTRAYTSVHTPQIATRHACASHNGGGRSCNA